MTLVALLIVPVSLGLISIVVKKSQRYFKKSTRIFRTCKWPSGRGIFGHNIVRPLMQRKRN